MSNRTALTFFLVVLLTPLTNIVAQEQSNLPDINPVNQDIQTNEQNQNIEYPAAFFMLYQPNSALDMVRQLPGFQLDDGDNTRGFAAAAGNILINGRLPSAKQASPSSILAGIPASQVASIELIRGQVRGVDMRGRSSVANILLHENSEAAIQWTAFLMHSNSSALKPGLNTSLSDRWQNIEYNAGLNVEGGANGESGPERVFDGNNALLESRFDDEVETGIRLTGVTLNAMSWFGETLFQFNGKIGFTKGPQERISIRTPKSPDERQYQIYFKDSQQNPSFEIGVDAERFLNNYLSGKLIFLHTYRSPELRSLQSTHNPDGMQTLLRIAESETISTEWIARMEFDWTGFPDHAIQLNLEGAYNSADGSLIQTVDRGAGAVVVDVPGANTLVEEVRGDFLIKDTWSLGQLELDYGLGAEVSTISQSGDEDLERNFFFVKPSVALTYSPGSGQQIRFKAEQEVAQLNFNDFISATVFGDDNLALGNPNLRPDKTWITELAYERRFARVGVIKITGFYHWITDVLDLLPFTSTDAVPGNIGDGRRWGLEIESTIPLARFGLTDSRFDVKARWQDSSVIDPVTGRVRRLSARGGFSGPPIIRFTNGNKYVFDFSYRQDFERARLAWGWKAAFQAERSLYKVNELDVYDEDVLITAFVETTRWLGIKIRLEGTNLLDYIEKRDRLLYSGSRDLSPVATRILRERNAGRRIALAFSGNF